MWRTASDKEASYKTTAEKLKWQHWVVGSWGCGQILEQFRRLKLKTWGFPGGSNNKESACNAGDPGSNPGLERSPEEGNGNLLQYSCLENYMDRETCQVIQSTGSQKSRTWPKIEDTLAYYLVWINTFCQNLTLSFECSKINYKTENTAKYFGWYQCPYNTVLFLPINIIHLKVPPFQQGRNKSSLKTQRRK